EQMSGEIAAVHARNIERQEGPEGAGLIPIEKMPGIPFEPLHGSEGILDSLEQLVCWQITKIPSGESCEEGHAHVRWGSGRSDDRDRNLLEVVWGQPILFRGDEGLKKMPGLA